MIAEFTVYRVQFFNLKKLCHSSCLNRMMLIESKFVLDNNTTMFEGVKMSGFFNVFKQ